MLANYCGNGLMTTCCLVLVFVASTECAVIIPKRTSFGEWEGFTVSLAWWGNVFGERDDIADWLFTLNDGVQLNELEGVTVPGLGFSGARYNIGACSFNEAPDGSFIQLSPNIPDWKQIEGYWKDCLSTDPASSSWSWDVDRTQRTALTKAIDRGSNIVELFSNSPMWWMLSNHNPSGSNGGSTDNLQSWNYQQHAVYMATVAEHMVKEWNISVTSIDPFNEPIADWWTADGTQEGCHFEHSTQETVLSFLRPELDSRNLTNIAIAASDESFVDMALDTWNSFNADTQALIDIINVHGYQGVYGDRPGLYDAASSAGKVLRNSEHGDGDSSGFSLAANWMLDFSRMHVTSMSYWQVLDGGGWGLLDSDLNAAAIRSINQKMYVVAQFSRHLRPGMQVLDAGDPSDMSTAAFDDETGRLVLISVNIRHTNEVYKYDLSAFSQEITTHANKAEPTRQNTTASVSVSAGDNRDSQLSSFVSCWRTDMVDAGEQQYQHSEGESCGTLHSGVDDEYDNITNTNTSTNSSTNSSSGGKDDEVAAAADARRDRPGRGRGCVLMVEVAATQVVTIEVDTHSLVECGIAVAHN